MALSILEKTICGTNRIVKARFQRLIIVVHEYGVTIFRNSWSIKASSVQCESKLMRNPESKEPMDYRTWVEKLFHIANTMAASSKSSLQY